MKNAGMRDPASVLSQKCREGWRYVGVGGWKSSDDIISPMVFDVVLLLVYVVYDMNCYGYDEVVSWSVNGFCFCFCDRVMLAKRRKEGVMREERS